MHFVIDADSIAYRAAAAAETRKWQIIVEDTVLIEFQYKIEVVQWALVNNIKDYTLNLVKELGSVDNALHNVNSICTRLVENEKCTSSEFHISGSNSFRKLVATYQPYKGNRNPNDKPAYLTECLNHLITAWGAHYNDWIEADDAVTMASLYHPNSVIVSIDKDLDMVPGNHYNWVKEIFYTISKEEGLRNFFTQMLVGDSTDNIKGISGIGLVKADKLLVNKSPEEMFDIVKFKYQEEFGDCWKSIMLQNGRLLWMMRYPNDIWDIPNG